MPDMNKAVGRVVALIVLLVLGAAALRGYLPAGDRPRGQPAHPASAFAVAALLSVTLAIVAVAFIARLRDRRTTAGGLAGLAEGAVGRGGRLSWRVVLIGLGVIAAWLLLVVLLMYIFRKHDIAELAQLPGSDDTTPERATSTPATGTPRPEPKPPRPSGGNVFGYLAASAAGMVVLIVVAVVIGVRSRLRVATPPGIAGDRNRSEADAATSDSLMRAAELGLAEIGDLGRGPREAIIACYATMERELAQVPDAVPQDYDTPSEVLARAVDHHALHANNAAQLVRLFAEARFSPHVMNEDHREAAVRVLNLVLAELPRTST